MQIRIAHGLLLCQITGSTEDDDDGVVLQLNVSALDLSVKFEFSIINHGYGAGSGDWKSMLRNMLR